MSKGQTESEASPLNLTEDSAAVHFGSQANGHSRTQDTSTIEGPGLAPPISVFGLEKEEHNSGKLSLTSVLPLKMQGGLRKHLWAMELHRNAPSHVPINACFPPRGTDHPALSNQSAHHHFHSVNAAPPLNIGDHSIYLQS